MTVKIIREENDLDIRLEIRIEVDGPIRSYSDSEQPIVFDFKVYDLDSVYDNARESEELSLFMEGFIKWDGCVNFEFNQEIMLHSCNSLRDFTKRMQWISEQIKVYSEVNDNL